ncbi:hypothetical protein [Proteiniphilum sp. X52]|uniref:hypothetical protein n=1 Tax=Proteiniphilum sp. X52 TaxID=2382159 RepID=UPI0013147609|nr:hypothetical protein [Proteiniphilum sp. X52]
MKEHWNNLVDQIQKMIDDEATVINGLRNGPDVTKIKKNFERNVKTLGKQIDEFSVFVPDPEADEIEMPFDSEEFAGTWKDYKEFLYDVFGIILVPVEERRRLKKLFNISKKNEERALEFLDFYICSRYKSIFLPKDFQLNNDQPGDEPAKESGFTLKKKTI